MSEGGMEDKRFEDLLVTDFAVPEHRSLWLDAWRRLIASRTAILGLVIVTVFVLVAVFSRFFWKYDPKTDLDYSLKLKPPTFVTSEEVPSIHPFGTDKLGRDIFRRVAHGGWNSLRVGLSAVGISLLVGGTLGLLAGFYESIPLDRLERGIMVALIGIALGSLPAWIANQWYLYVLFGALGIISVQSERLRIQRRTRYIAFAALGLLIGGLLGLSVGIYTAFVNAILGLLIGLILALPLGGSLLSNIIMRMMDIILAFPGILLAIAIVAFLGPGLDKTMIAVGFVSIPIYARLVRSTVLSVIQKEYVLAAQSIGEGHGRIIIRYIIPNSLSPIIVQTTMGLASAIIWAAALGFLGLGAIPPEPEWGAMLGDSYRFLSSGAWWAVLFPGLAIMLSVLGFNLLGDGLRDALDPRIRN